MNDMDMKKVTSIEFTIDGEEHPKMRFVLNGHRDDMHRMEDEMEECGCEPLLVVDKADHEVWWSDDYMFLIDQMCVSEDDLADAYDWALMVTECDVWWQCDEGVIFRTREGSVIRATISTMPCDTEHGQYTNDCDPISREEMEAMREAE